MKAAVALVAIFALALLAIPMIALNFEAAPAQGMQAQVHSPVPAPVPDTADSTLLAAELEGDSKADELPERTAALVGAAHFLILNESTGQVEEVSARDYVRGALAMEMPASFHPEALKAQAVAAHTYALAQRARQQASPDPRLQGADFTADPQNRIGYITQEQALEFYGENGQVYWERICSAADSVLEVALTYDDQPIVAAYHAISAGRTEDAANVWTGSAPYLVPVDSEGDFLAPDYHSTASFPADEVSRRILASYPDADLSGSPMEWFGETLYSDSGYVVYLDVGGVEIPGLELRQLLGLRSHNFEVNYTDAGFTFQVYGYGHGVGLSQYGADYMARQGSGWEEILENYYPGATLAQVVY